MLREGRVPKVYNWLINYLVKKSPPVEDLWLVWFGDPDPAFASAGWALTTERVAKDPDGLDVIETDLREVPDRLQRAMNACLAQLCICHAGYRKRSLSIGERLEVLKGYLTPPAALPRMRRIMNPHACRKLLPVS